MAKVLSGSFNTNAYGERNLVFSWSATQSIEKNESYINWSLKGGGSGDQYYMAAPFTVKIAGETVYSSTTRIQLYKDTVVATGSKTIAHNNSGVKSFTASVEAAIYTFAVNCKGSATWELKDIPRAAEITSAPNFDDDANAITIVFSNPLANRVTKLETCISLDRSKADILYREIDKAETSYTYNLTEDERNVLRRAAANQTSIPIYFFIRTTMDSQVFLRYVKRTCTIVNANPILNYTIGDTNPKTLDLTNDPLTFVKGFSKVEYAIDAEPQKFATITKYSVTDGRLTFDTATGVNETVESGSYRFTVEDSRGNKTTESFYRNNFIHYIPLTCDLEATIPTTDGQATIIISGNYYNGSFGAVDNSLGVYYTYKINNEDYWDYVPADDVEIDAENNTYTAIINFADLNYLNSYTFKAYAADKLTNIESAEKKVKTIPVFDWSETDFNFNVPIAIQGNNVADFVVQTGESAMGTNGTWYWCKWASGRAECYGVRNFGNMAITTAHGSLFMSEAFTQTLPSGLFADTPQSININCHHADSNAGWVMPSTNATVASKSNTGGFRVVRGVSGNASQLYICFNVIGKWK